MSGIYIHIPFCKQACHYCNFHFATSLDYKPEMVAAICRELELKKGRISGNINTIYFGGGTPSLLNRQDMEAIFKTIQKNYSISDSPEVTIEVNPDDINADYIHLLHDLPINRLSIGIQSFFDDDLRYMNRAHSAKEARQSLDLCLASNIDNFSADLIYATPTLSNQNWGTNIDTLIELEIPHLSCYQLTVEEKTPLEAFIERGQLNAPSDDRAIEQFYILLDRMDNHRYETYEISNYAKKGFRSRHNSAYWTSAPYIGIGPSAHSFDGVSRSWNIVVNNRYMEEIEQNRIPENKEILSTSDRYNEFVLTRLRTIEGINKKDIEHLFPNQFEHFIKSLSSHVDKTFYQEVGGDVSLTRAGKIWADGISAVLMV